MYMSQMTADNDVDKSSHKMASREGVRQNNVHTLEDSWDQHQAKTELAFLLCSVSLTTVLISCLCLFQTVHRLGNVCISGR